MLGLTVLFFLAVWVIITLVAMRFGWKFGKKTPTKLLGAFLGFMLTMGGFIVYWTVEYIQLQRTVTHLCETEGGLTVYVTPEEWRKQIGEDEWAMLLEYWRNIDHDLTFQFEGKTYYGNSQLNPRFVSYEAKDERQDIIRDTDEIYIDKNTHQVLFRSHDFSVGVPAIANSLNGLKFWLDNIDDCSSSNWSYEDRFFHRKYTNYSLTKGE